MGGWVPLGSSGATLAECINTTVRDTRIVRVRNDGGWDGVGFDFEKDNDHCTIEDSYIAHTEGAGIMLPSGNNHNIRIRNCLIWDNNLRLVKFPDIDEKNYSVMSGDPYTTDGWIETTGIYSNATSFGPMSPYFKQGFNETLVITGKYCDGWTPVYGELDMLDVGGNGNIWGVRPSGDVRKWTGGGVYTGDHWTPVPGSLEEVSVGSDGVVWGTASNDTVWRYDGGSTWTQMPGLMEQVSVGSAGSIWGTSPSGSVYEWNGGSWTQRPGLLTQVDAGPVAAGRAWGVNGSAIFRWNGTSWEGKSGQLTQISARSYDVAYGVNGGVVYRTTDGGQSWASAPGSLKQVSVGSDGMLWGVDVDGHIWRLIEGLAAPSAEFSAFPRKTGAGGTPVRFTDESAGDPIVWSWQFGDGGSSTLKNPSHVYQSVGTYTVSLTVSSGFGSSTKTKAEYITVIDCGGNCPPQFIATPEKDGVVEVDAGGTVAFVDLCGSPGATRGWSFGDGTSEQAFGPTVAHTYSTAGTFDVTLTIGCGLWAIEEDYVHVGDPAVYAEILAGPGSGRADGANPNLPIVRGANFIESNGTPYAIVPSSTRINAFPGSGHGINLGAGRLRKCPIVWGVGRDCNDPKTPSASVLTAPGPGFTFGPQVRAWNGDGTAISKVNFYAYGTLKYGARTSAGDVDPLGPDTAEEILTGPGPGSVFGPHVRGFNVDGGTATAIPKISFFAYSTLKYGVNVTATDWFEEFHGDEIVTGPGPGSTFGSQVRGFAWSNEANKKNTIFALAKVNFYAYTGPSLFYGVKVGGGAYNTQTSCQNNCPPDTPAIATGPGPGATPDHTGWIKVWHSKAQWPFVEEVGSPAGGVVPDNPAFKANQYGAEVAMGEIRADTLGDEVIAGAGPDPSRQARVVGILYDDVNDKLATMPKVDYLPFGDEETFGATVAAVPRTTPFNGNFLVNLAPVDHLIVQAHRFAEAIPDSTFLCKCCDKNEPVPKGYWNGWGSDETKKTVLQKLHALEGALPDFGKNFGGIIAALEDIRSYLLPSAGGILDNATRAGLDQQLVAIERIYQPVSPFASSAVTARLPGFDKPEIMALSEPEGRLFVDLGLPPPAPATFVEVLDVGTLEKEHDRTLPSNAEARYVAVPAGRPEAYVVTARQGCPDPDQGPCTDLYAFSIFLDRLGTNALEDDALFVTYPTPPDSVRALWVTPPASITSGLRPDAAYVGLAGYASISLYEVAGIRDFATATVTQLGASEMAFADPHVALCPSPLEGSPMLYVATPAGLDAVNTVTHEYVAGVGDYPSSLSGHGSIASGVTATGMAKIFVAAGSDLLVYQPNPPEDADSASLVDDVVLPGPLAAVTLSRDGKLVLVTRYPDAAPIQTLIVLDADTHEVIRESEMAECPSQGPCAFVSGRPMALTIDGSHAIVSSPDSNELEYVYLGPPRLSLVGQTLETTVAAVPLDAFTSNGGRQQLINEATLAEEFLVKAETLPDPASEQMLKNAALQLDAMMEKVDGCSGGSATDDVITPCAEKASVLAMASDIESMALGQVAADCPEEPPEQ